MCLNRHLRWQIVPVIEHPLVPREAGPAERLHHVLANWEGVVGHEHGRQQYVRCADDFPLLYRPPLLLRIAFCSGVVCQTPASPCDPCAPTSVYINL